ncbi:carboxymuconolactone decarboxylase family protein [Klebsiella michiganensis]|uniref:carboxymuconolactone decarboxylase family protein n=1 Tax=Klebsiella michiganensis TaxID=1134687 RepID=UPI00062C4DC1|nr:carboxymuconolactone decarboxylase family protein [Klebsiella michiganensis]ELN3893983.1 carboxymuconolactone decarboxylase family protein [Klebsiella michiganensis]ELS5413546.1 carboxymuconolactone decarboxylase family protein [Klebsiella michiganensis]KKY76463.1 4-carboxymuconolactone decarboxylase [Klebsiella michiganensis]MDU3693340.1 carboxymuconolactone decarboxylase family protein [Klebsiella michiganensis]MDU3714372.1 carboxymuconolactone decarboxylase family protein [Klebsiella mic
MKISTAVALALSLGSAVAIAETGTQRGPLSDTDIEAVSPALERYASTRLAGDLWKRKDLSPRDRSLVTVAAVIAQNQTVLLPEQLDLALKNGVKPAELSETITHLAFYAGWGNAIAAAAVTKEIFLQKRINAEQLPHAEEELLPVDEKSEAARAERVERSIGSAAPGLVSDTTDVLFRELWLRPGLAPRDRSLVTLSALIANGQTQQIPPHLNRAMENGLTRQQASGALSHLAYYTGWPNAFSAAPVFKTVFEQRESK